MYEILDKMNWSFSSVNNYCTCPYGFKLSYIEKKSKINNAFAEFGSFIHSLLERYFRGEVEFFELSQIYKDEYDVNVLHKFPDCKFCDLTEKYYKDGLSYLDSFEGLDSDLEVVGIEQKVELEINGKPFIGYIDLILRDKTDGRYIIVDHKSKARFKSKKEREHYLLQLYLYSLHVKKIYGEYPKQLKFNMFRTKTWESEDFSEKTLQKAINWFDFTIELIKNDTDFVKMKDEFYCENLCSVREHCKKEE